MDLFAFINRGVALNSQQEPVVLLTGNAAVISAMMGISEADVTREAETNLALEDLGDGVFQVWSGLVCSCTKPETARRGNCRNVQ